MKTISFILLLLLSFVYSQAESERQISYQRPLDSKTKLMVLVTEDSLSVSTDTNWLNSKEKKIERDDYQPILETAKDLIAEAIIDDSGREKGNPKDTDSHVVVFSGTSSYSYSWKFTKNDFQKLEALLLKYFDSSTFEALLSKRSNPEVINRAQPR